MLQETITACNLDVEKLTSSREDLIVPLELASLYFYYFLWTIRDYEPDIWYNSIDGDWVFHTGTKINIEGDKELLDVKTKGKVTQEIETDWWRIRNTYPDSIPVKIFQNLSFQTLHPFDGVPYSEWQLAQFDSCSLKHSFQRV